MVDLYEKLLERILKNIPSVNTSNLSSYPIKPGMTNLEFGKMMEMLFTFKMYIQNHKYLLYKLECREMANYISIRSHHNHEIAREDKTGAFVMALGTISMHSLCDKFDVGFLDKELDEQFKECQQFFEAKYRCLIQPRFLYRTPDFIIDDMLIDFKTDIDVNKSKNHWQQVFNQYLSVIAVQQSKEAHFYVSDYDKQLILYPINKIGIYYWRYNHLSIIDLQKVLSPKELFELASLRVT